MKIRWALFETDQKGILAVWLVHAKHGRTLWEKELTFTLWDRSPSQTGPGKWAW